MKNKLNCGVGLNYVLETDVFDKQIHQTLTAKLDETVQTVSQWVADTRDKHTRQGLIQLGWTPPPEKLKEYTLIYTLNSQPPASFQPPHKYSCIYVALTAAEAVRLATERNPDWKIHAVLEELQ